MGLKLLGSAVLGAFVALFAVIYSRDGLFDPDEVKGMRVLITEASIGIGEQMAYHFAKMGATLVLTDGREEVLSKVLIKCKSLSPSPTPKHTYIVGDMSKVDDAAMIIKFTKKHLGGLDMLVLTHALITMCNPWTGTRANLSILATGLDIGFRSHVHLASHALPLLEKSRGRIAVVTSMAGAVGSPHMSVYTASKRALVGFFDVLRQDLMIRNSRVSVTLCSIGGSMMEVIANFILYVLQVDRRGQLNLGDPRAVAMEIIKSVMARKYEIYTSVSTWSALLPGSRTDCTSRRSRSSGPSCMVYCYL